MKNKTTITHIIFDMNGVLIDDEALQEEAFRQVCVEYGLELSHSQYLQFCMGRTDEDGFLHIQKHLGLPESLDILLEKKYQKYLDVAKDQLRSPAEVLEVLESLYNDCTLAVTTSATRQEAKLVLDSLGIWDKFKVIVTSEGIKKGKPDPEPYLLTADKLGALPKECVVVEDTPSGITSAKAAGMRVVAVTTTHEADDLKEADVVIDNFSELTNVI